MACSVRIIAVRLAAIDCAHAFLTPAGLLCMCFEFRPGIRAGA